MKASELRTKLPEIPEAMGPARATALAERERLLLEAVVAGHTLPIEWVEVDTVWNGHTATFYVMADALMWGEPGDAVRANVSHRTAQRIADHLGVLLPTSKLVELAYRVSAKLHPQKGDHGPSMSSTTRMFEHSALVDAEVARARAAGCANVLLAPNVGKLWVLSIRLAADPTKAANFGWYEPGARYVSPGGLPIWQNVGLGHLLDHVDYSQVAWFVRADMIVDGQVRQLADVLRDPALGRMVSFDGPLPWARHPGVPFELPYADTERPTDVDGGMPELRIKSKGPMVGKWQRWLLREGFDLGVWGADEDFGRATQLATIAAQKRAGLPGTGIVDTDTWRLYRATPAPSSRPRVEEVEISFVQAKHFHKGRRDPVTGAPCGVDLIVLHTMEALERLTTAEGCASYFRDPRNAKKEPVIASAHYCADADSFVRCVLEEDTAFAAPGANHNGVQIEMAGYARQTPEEWADDFSRRMLELVAQLCADIARRHGIPVAYRDVAELRAGGARGITTHHAVTLAFRRSTHTDPGMHFPMPEFLARVRAIA